MTIGRDLAALGCHNQLGAHDMTRDKLINALAAIVNITIVILAGLVAAGIIIFTVPYIERLRGLFTFILLAG